MSSEGFQIEIPSFDEDEDYSNVITPMPAGHQKPFFDPDSPLPNTGGFSAAPGGSFSLTGGPAGSYGADDSPSGPGRHFANRHARGDSTSSDNSVLSLGQRSLKSSAPSSSRLGASTAAHSSSSSVATTATTATSTSTPSKKTSFASLRAAMKSVRAFAESSERVPPVPTLNLNKDKSVDAGAGGKEGNYPELRNPFAKSSREKGEPQTPGRHSPALSIKSSMKKRGGGGLSTSTSVSASRSRPSQSQTQTQGLRRNPSTVSTGGGGGSWGLTHSAAPSWAYDSDHSDQLHGLSGGNRQGRGESIPPVPALPRALNTPRIPQVTINVEEAIGLGQAAVQREGEGEPKTPGELALHVVFTGFVAKVEEKIRRVLEVGLDKEPSLPQNFGPKVDPSLDALFLSLGHIAQRHASSVIEALMRWRKTQREGVQGEVVEKAVAGSGKARGLAEARGVLNSRKHLASIYVFSRALLVLIRTINKDSMPESLSLQLESTIFSEYRDLDPRALAQSGNRKAVASLYVEVLGAMADTRFQSVTDHFLDTFSALNGEQGQADNDLRYEHVLRGLKHVKIKVWPPEAFEEGAEFLDAFAGHFANVHGQTIKTAFAEALTGLLHPVRKTAGAEVNHPLWSKAIQSIYPRAFAMMGKPRYWASAFPLTITAVCLAPAEFFAKHWMACFDLCVAKLKDKTARGLALNGICRLLWTYLYRSDEAGSTSLKTLEGCVKSIVPPNRPLQLTPEEPLDLFVYILQLACGRHFDYGRELVLDFLQDPSLSSTGQSGSISLQSPEKMTIALRAAVLALRGMESDTPPAWPESSDFTLTSIGQELPPSTGSLSDQTLAKPGVRDFVDRLSPLVMKVTATCDRLVGDMLVSDDSYSYSHQASTYEERENLVVRQNGSRMVAYRKDLVSAMDLLRACYDALPVLWPRTSKLSSTLGRLIEGVAHVNPVVGQAATEALQRFSTAIGDETSVLLHITRWLFASEAVLQSDAAIDLMSEHLPMLELWLQLIGKWAEKVYTASQGPAVEGQVFKPEPVAQLVGQIEAGCLFAICSTKLQVREVALKALRVVADLPDSCQPASSTPGDPFRLLSAMEGTIGQSEYAQECDRAVTLADEDRMTKWLDRGSTRNLVKLIQDDNTDRYLWRLVFPPFLRVCLVKRTALINSFRSTLAGAVARMHPTISSHAGISTKAVTATMRSPVGGQIALNDSAQASAQWLLWVLALSAIAVPTDNTTTAKEHARHGSDPIPLQERILAPRGLIRLLLPYLDADTRALREGTVYALGCVHPRSLRAVLEDTSSVIRNIYIEAHAALSQKRAMQRHRDQDRLHTSVMHVFALAADWAKKPLDDRDQLVQLMLTFYKSGIAFFRDAVSRKDHELLSLRKHFCGFVEQLFQILLLDGPWDKPEPEMYVRTYRYCEEWCDYVYPSGQSDAALVRALADSATRAIASITAHPILFDVHSVQSRGHQSLRPVAYGDVLRWIEGMLPSNSLVARDSAMRTLKNLCGHSLSDDRMSAILVGSCLPTAREPAVAAICFDIVADKLDEDFKLVPPSRLLFLCLSNLVHPDVNCRRKALYCLERLLQGSQKAVTLATFRSAVEVIPEGSHVKAQRAVSRTLAETLPGLAVAFLAECASRFSQGYSDSGNTMLVMLEPWMEHINLVVPEGEDNSVAARALTNLLSISAVHLLGNFADEVRALWQQLACGRFPGNHRAIIHMCIVHAMRCGREDFIRIVQAGISAFSMTPIAVDAFNFLCDWITVQTIALSKLEDSMTAPTEAPSELDSLFPPSEDTVRMSSGQAACLLLSDLALADPSEMAAKLPLLLTAVLNLVDHEQALIRIDAHMLLIRILRLCALNEGGSPSVYTQLRDIEQLLRSDSAHFAWMTDNRRPRPDPRGLVVTLCEGVVQLLDPRLPTLRHDWSDAALDWSVKTSSRQVAMRSLQVLCILRLDFTYHTLAMLLGRLSNIVSGDLEQGNLVASEIITGIRSLSSSATLQQLLDHPQLLWTGMACLYSTSRHEFSQGVEILDNIFRILEPSGVDGLFACLNARPDLWTGPNVTLFQLLSPGLRSSVTSDVTFRLIDRLAGDEMSPFFEGDDLHRVIAVSMPRFLDKINGKTEADEQIKTYAVKLSVIADRLEWPGMVRVLTSYAKDRFRGKDDFVRQMISCLRERVPAGGWLDTITLLLGLVFNNNTEMRVNTMFILKQLFSMPDIRGQLRLFGSEHLTPLLRLLNTDLASQALEVLDEPMSVSGGMPARQVVRMSLINGPAMRKQEDRTPGVIFGVPDASGWCVAQPDSTRGTCRQNITALYEVCNNKRVEIARISGVDLFGEDDISNPAQYGRPESVSGFNDDGEDGSFGDLVSTLYDLSNYFEEEDMDGDDTLPSSSSLDSMRDAESRVAAILSRSIHPGNPDTTPTGPVNGKPPYGGELADPPTPFLDLFSMASPMDADPSGFDQQYESDNEGYFASLPSNNFSHHASSSWESDAPSESDTSSVFGLDDRHDDRTQYYNHR